MLKKVSTFPYSLLHCRIVHSEPWASPHESKVRTHLMIQRRELVSFLTGLLHSSRIKLSCEAEFQMAWWYWLPKTTCLLSPAGTEVIAQLLAEPHSPYNSHLSQFPHWEIHICCPWAIDLLGLSLSHTSPQHVDHNVGTSPLNLPCLQCQPLAYTSSPQLPLADCVREQKEGWDLKLRGIAYFRHPQQELEFSHLPSTLNVPSPSPSATQCTFCNSSCLNPAQLNHCPPTWQAHNLPEGKICWWSDCSTSFI